MVPQRWEASSRATVGRLERYTVEGLFDSRDFSFATATEGPTVLTGTNGSGKSTVLRTLDAVGTGNWPALVRLPFRALKLDFSDFESLTVDRREDELQIAAGDKRWVFSLAHYFPQPLDELDRLPPGVRRRAAGYELDGRPYSGAELTRELAIRNMLAEDDASWVSSISACFPVLFITDQRLTIRDVRRPPRDARDARAYRPTPRTVVAVAEFARDLRMRIASTQNTYATSSQRLDQAFPQKVVEAMSGSQDTSLDELHALLTRVEGEATSLRRVGLLPEEGVPGYFDEKRLDDPDVRPVIKAVAEDTLAKFAVLASLRTQLEVFLTFLNDHYRDKTVQIYPDRGFVIELPGQNLLAPSQLSSGEQQILALAYEMLFRTEPGTLVLVDEPELSLHVLWQRSLIEDLSAMGEARGLDFLLATHSPTIIGDRRDLLRSMDEDTPVAEERLFPSEASAFGDEPSVTDEFDAVFDDERDFLGS